MQRAVSCFHGSIFFCFYRIWPYINHLNILLSRKQEPSSCPFQGDTADCRWINLRLTYPRKWYRSWVASPDSTPASPGTIHPNSANQIQLLSSWLALIKLASASVVSGLKYSPPCPSILQTFLILSTPQQSRPLCASNLQSTLLPKYIPRSSSRIL